MSDWPLTCMFIAFGMVMLIGWPIAAMPGLPMQKKLYWLLALFFIFIPAAISLFIWLAAPDVSLLKAL
jgi:cyanate permease